MGSSSFLIGQNVSQTREDGLRSEGEGLGALLDGMQDVEDLGMAEAFELTNRAAEDLRDGFLALRLVELLGAALFEEKD